MFASALATAMLAAPSAAFVGEALDILPDAGTEKYRGGRGKGKQARPRKRPNMKTISKRVRRKHRRAA